MWGISSWLLNLPIFYRWKWIGYVSTFQNGDPQKTANVRFWGTGGASGGGELKSSRWPEVAELVGQARARVRRLNIIFTDPWSSSVIILNIDPSQLAQHSSLRSLPKVMRMA